MQDIINSFKAHLYERTSSPLIGSFIFYWLICNYKLIIVLLDGDLKSQEKFDLIKTLYPQEIFTLWNGFDIYYYTLLSNGFLIPLLITLAYIFIVPYPSKYIYQFWKNKQREIHEIKQKIDDETPLTKEQSKKIRQDMINLEIEYENSFKRKDEEIYQLKEMLKIKDSNNSTANSVNEYFEKKEEQENIQKYEFSNTLTNMNTDDKNSFNSILLLIGGNNNGFYGEEIEKQFKDLKEVKVKFFLDILLNNNFIDISTVGKYIITSKGTKYLYNNSLI